MFYREGEVEVVPGRPSLYRTMLRVVWKELLLSALLRMVVLLWEFSQPLLLQYVQVVTYSIPVIYNPLLSGHVPFIARNFH